MLIASFQPTTNILLPMHDALLLEIPKEHSEELTTSILHHYHEAFLNVCPGIAPRVTVEPFAKEWEDAQIEGAFGHTGD